jgi:transposase
VFNFKKFNFYLNLTIFFLKKIKFKHHILTFINIITFKMPKGKQLTEFERGEIVGLRKANFSIREIAIILKRSKTAVENAINDYFKKDKTSAILRSGRPKKLTERNNRQIIKIVKKTPKITVKEITQELKELNISACESTIRHVLHFNNYYGRIAIKKPLVSEKNRKKRFG